MAFDRKFCNTRRNRVGSVTTTDPQSTTRSRRPRCRAIGSQRGGDAAQYLAGDDRARLRTQRTGIELGDVEQRLKQFVDSAERLVDLPDQRHHLPAARAFRQGTGEQARGMQRLQQIVAGRRKEPRLADIGCVRLRLGLRQLRIETGQLAGALAHPSLQKLVGLAKHVLGAALFGDVLVEREEADDLTGTVEMRDIGSARDLDAGLRKFDLERLAFAGQHGLDVDFQAPIALVAQHVANRPADDAAGRAQGILVGLVGEAIALVPVGIGDQHRNIVGIDPDAPFAVAQRLDRLHALGDVGADHDETAGRHRIGLQLQHAPVRPAPLVGVRAGPPHRVVLRLQQHAEIDVEGGAAPFGTVDDQPERRTDRASSSAGPTIRESGGSRRPDRAPDRTCRCPG